MIKFVLTGLDSVFTGKQLPQAPLNHISSSSVLTLRSQKARINQETFATVCSFSVKEIKHVIGN